MTYEISLLATDRVWPGDKSDEDTITEDAALSSRGQTASSSCGLASDPAQWEPASSRYTDRPISLGTRMFGLVGTALIYLVIAGVGLFALRVIPLPVVPTATMTVFNIAEPQAPPAPETEIPPGPEEVQTELQPPKIEVIEVPPPLVLLPSTSSTAVATAEPVTNPGPPIDRTTAPESLPQPPGSNASDAKPTWEGQVLAALNQAKRYPREASRNRQQGMPWIRFVIDRDGRVRSVRLVRSSGFDALDREAEALPMRASPLPRPPDSVKGERITLTVPIEFFMQG